MFSQRNCFLSNILMKISIQLLKKYVFDKEIVFFFVNFNKDFHSIVKKYVFDKEIVFLFVISTSNCYRLNKSQIYFIEIKSL